MEKEIRKYDDKGNCIYCKDINGVEHWYDRDKNNNCIHYKNSNNREYWKDYNENGICVYFKDDCGCEIWYDENGNAIHFKDYNNGYEWKKENNVYITANRKIPKILKWLRKIKKKFINSMICIYSIL